MIVVMKRIASVKVLSFYSVFRYESNSLIPITPAIRNISPITKYAISAMNLSVRIYSLKAYNL